MLILKVYSIHNIWDKTQILKKFPSDKIKGTKKCPLFFFFLQAPTHHSFIFNLWFLDELKYKVRLSKTVCGVFYFWFRFVFIKVYFFCPTKRIHSLTLKLHNSFQNQNNKNFTDNFASRPLIFKLQQEVLKSNDICMSWSSSKTDLVTNVLNLENWSFRNVSFSQ